ncbi:restriction endonuclease [Archangium violaceum]|uniref:HTH domain-containing protein n=1 Tax=Archangium violaceum TaxID=83451 RepID=UPI001951D804|nr:HTH domain-containing protein [Archangium violaceum]QRN93380.1 restriction endonuclease [Archangium violaceum]
MTFYEAALRVLESEGRPLTFLEITEKSIAQNLLSHVGKTPELTMLSRLAAMARRTRDRKVVVTAKDTFALADWALPEDAEALAQTGVMEAHPEDSLPPLRPTERHPEPRTDNVRVAGRGSERKQRRREDEEEGRGGRRRRFPPMPEVVFEILSEGEQALRPEQLLEQIKTKELAAEDTTVELLLTALLEDNQRRIDAGRRPQFALTQGEVTLERAGAPSEAPPLELQAAFAAALGIPLEDGRPVLPRTGAAAAATPEAQADAALLTTARTALKDARKAVARAVRKRLGELDVGTFEKSVVKMMHALGFRELKVAKRSKEGPLLTARKREGSVDLRFAIRMLKGTPSLDRKAVQELRKDLGHYSAQVGLLACAGDVRGDARTEAQASGSLVMLWCGDALGEKFLEAKAAVTVTTVELYDLDERFFEVAKLEADEAQKRREERQREKQAREEDEGGEETEPRAAAAPAEADEEGQKRREQRREERQREREERREERRRERLAREQARAEGAEKPAAPAVAPTEAAAPTGLSEEEQGEEGEDEEGEDEDLEAANAFVGGQPAEGGAAGESAAAGERKRRRRRRRGRRGRGGRGPEGAEAAPGTGTPGAPGEPGTTPGTTGEAVVAAEGAAAAVGVTSAEGALIAGAVAEASPEAAATAAGAEPSVSDVSEATSTPGEGMRTAAEWQTPFPSVESAAPAEAQRTAAEEYARAAAEKAESVAEGARAPSEPAASNEPPPSGSGSPEGGTT